MIFQKKYINTYFFYCAAYLLYLCLFSGCTQSSPAPYDLYKAVTLRTASSNLASSTEWTALQPEYKTASDSESSFIRLPAGSTRNPEALFVVFSDADNRVYPFLDGFAYLDTGTIPHNALSLLHDVLDGCKKKELNENCFPDSWVFLKIISEYELKKLPDIKSWIIGRAYKNTEDIYEIPVRFFTRDNFFHAFIYMFEEKNDVFKVEQIVFEEP